MKVVIIGGAAGGATAARIRRLDEQAVGYKGVEKRVDVLATAIRAGISGTELKDLDLTYAPPYSSAKDPVNMAGFMIDNIEKEVLKQFRFPFKLLFR